MIPRSGDGGCRVGASGSRAMELDRAEVAEASGQAAVNGFGPAGSDATLNGHAFGMQELLHALQAVRSGDFSVRLPTDQTGLEGKICDTFNEIVASNECMAKELEHVGQVVGREGKTRARVKLALSGGAWREMRSEERRVGKEGRSRG